MSTPQDIDKELPPTPALSGLGEEEIQNLIADLSLPRFRANQILNWLYQKRKLSWEAMANLPGALRSIGQQRIPITASRLENMKVNKDGTRKAVLKLGTGEPVEAVLIADKSRYTACLSTQVGCPIGCVFCASGLQGLARNLSRAEITDQMLFLNHDLNPDEKIANIVFMGMGEPLANLPVVLEVIDTLTAPWGFKMSPRRITVSTVGLVKGMLEMKNLARPVNLAVSLHAPNEYLRKTLVPTSKPGDLRKILEAVSDYQVETGRRLTFEYVLLGEVNDQPAQARELAGLLRNMDCRVNLIPYNQVDETPFKRPARDYVYAFAETLKAAGIRTTTRVQKGAEMDAACGQLTWQQRKKTSSP